MQCFLKLINVYILFKNKKIWNSSNPVLEIILYNMP